MNTSRTCALFLFAIASSFAPGCALFSKGDQGDARFFSLERESHRPYPVPATVPGAEAKPTVLRLGLVTGAPHLEERLVYRDSAYEVGYYRELRWTEPPERRLKRLLARVLFEERGFQQLVGGAGTTLEVQLTALDEIRFPRHLARARAVARLHDERLVLWEETLTVDRPIIEENGGDLALATVTALGDALLAAVDQIADSVAREIDEQQLPAPMASGAHGRPPSSELK